MSLIPGTSTHWNVPQDEAAAADMVEQLFAIAALDGCVMHRYTNKLASAFSIADALRRGLDIAMVTDGHAGVRYVFLALTTKGSVTVRALDQWIWRR